MSLGAAAKGGLSGAGVGSMFGPVGTVVGGGIGFFSGLFGGGDDDEEDKPKFDSEQTAIDTIGQLKGQSAKNAKRGDALGGMSDESLGPVVDYFKSLASGDNAAVMAATAPERGRVIDQYDAARKAATVAAPRGGGTTSAIVQSYITEANQLGDLTATARREGASALGSLGVNLAGLGLSADQLASADLDSIIRAVFGERQLANERRGQTMALWGDIGQAAGSVIGGMIGGGGDD